MSTTNIDPDLAEDRLVGVEAIAKFRGDPLRRTFFLLSRGMIPGFKEGRLWISSRRALRAHHERQFDL